MGVIVAEVLKKWGVLGAGADSMWVVAILWILFLCKEIVDSDYLENHLQRYSSITRNFGFILNIILVVISISVIISIPFIWYGTIEGLAKAAGQ